MNSKQRQSVASRVRYRIYLDNEQRMVDLIEEFFMPVAEFNRHDKLDRAVIAKIAHWFGVYVKKFNTLPKEFDALKAQYALTAVLTGVEAAIGMPKKGGGTRVAEFYKANLGQADQDALTKSIDFYNTKTGEFESRSLEVVIGQLIQRRHGLLHRAELINLAGEGIMGVGSRGHTTGKKASGKIRHFLDIKLTPDAFTQYTLNALKNYFSLPWRERIPGQNFMIISK